jgi:heterodisulfide reductase subunit C
MDYTPRQIVAMIRAGLKNDVLTSYTTWLCASCYACTVECPKDIPITDIMYATKRIAIRQRVYPKRFPTPVLANEFFGGVETTGRSSEGRLLINLFLKTNPLQLLKQAGLGMRLLLQGRMSLRQESVKRRKELQGMLKVLEKEYMIELAARPEEGS